MEDIEDIRKRAKDTFYEGFTTGIVVTIGLLVGILLWYAAIIM